MSHGNRLLNLYLTVNIVPDDQEVRQMYFGNQVDCLRLINHEIEISVALDLENR